MRFFFNLEFDPPAKASCGRKGCERHRRTERGDTNAAESGKNDEMRQKIERAIKTSAKNVYEKGGKLCRSAAEKVCEASDTLSQIRREIKEDVASVRERDPAAKSDVEVLLLYSGVHAILAYRVSHRLYVGKKYFSARAVSQIARFFTGIEIHPGAKIGHGLFIDHGAGVVIGETCEIGDNCTLYQGVTLGGTGKHSGKRHPTLGNNVLVGAGAKVLGPFTVGDNAKVAAGAVVLKEIPANCTAVGIPAQVVRRDGQKIRDGVKPSVELDQVHVPDPIAARLTELEAKLDELAKNVENPNENNNESNRDNG